MMIKYSPPNSFSSSTSCMADLAAERIGHLFEVCGNYDYIGEPVSILEHSWQAYQCAKTAPATTKDEDVVTMASLLHDIGHMLGMEAGFPVGMNGCGVPHHESIGQDFLLSLGFPARVAWLVGNHVHAKRFLVWKDPNYELSDASRTTLAFQGGPMTDEEAQQFMSVDGYEAVLDMRLYDEAAKVSGLPKPSIQDIKSLIREYLKKTMSLVGTMSTSHFLSRTYRLSSEQQRFFREQGYLVVKGLGLTDAPRLSEMTDALSQAAESIDDIKPAYLLVHHEQVTLPSTDESKIQLCRVENFVQQVEDWFDVEEFVRGICTELFDEPAVLFKDKLNFKLPGGGGFFAHQDVTAYKSTEFASTHISVMVAIDPALSSETGPLEMAGGRHSEGIFPHTKGVIDPSVEESMDFRQLFVDAGDLVFFDSYVPHRSGMNRSTQSRRLAYLTYNKLSEGDFNQSYYAAKLDVLAKGTGRSISINNDFAGTIVEKQVLE